MPTLTSAYQLIARWQAAWSLAHPLDNVAGEIRIIKDPDLGKFGARVAVTRDTDDDFIIVGTGYNNDPIRAVQEAIHEFGVRVKMRNAL